MVKGNDMKGITGIIIAVILSSAYCYSQDTIAKPKIEVSGRAAFESGQIANGHFNEIVFPYRVWIDRGYFNLRLQSRINSKLVAAVEPEIRVWSNTWPVENKSGDVAGYPLRQYTTVSILEGQGIFSLYGNDNPALRVAIGFFPYKYNAGAKNLGEYLFRSGTYPPYLINSFGNPFSRLSGFHLSSTLFTWLQQDFFIHPEIQVQPLMDWSVSYVAKATYKMVEVGAGLSLNHWFPAVDRMTQPKFSSNRYYTITGDSAWFSFKGIKYMGQLAFDLKKCMSPETANKFGPEDFRLYSEIALLGSENYPAYSRKDTVPTVGGPTVTSWIPDTNNNFYEDILQRMPIMIGFNFPTGALLDYCSLEIESYEWPYKNTYFNQTNNSENPQPGTINPNGQYKKIDYRYDNWKWSFNIKRTVAKGFSVIGQFARDHSRSDISNEKAIRDDDETMTRSNEWSWMVRLQCNF
jgi:hypothetical protein